MALKIKMNTLLAHTLHYICCAVFFFVSLYFSFCFQFSRLLNDQALLVLLSPPLCEIICFCLYFLIHVLALLLKLTQLKVGKVRYPNPNPRQLKTL